MIFTFKISFIIISIDQNRIGGAVDREACLPQRLDYHSLVLT